MLGPEVACEQPMSPLCPWDALRLSGQMECSTDSQGRGRGKWYLCCVHYYLLSCGSKHLKRKLLLHRASIGKKCLPVFLSAVWPVWALQYHQGLRGMRCRSRRWEGGNRPPSPLQDFTSGRPCRTDVPYGLLLQVHTPSSLKPLHRLCLPLGTPCPGSLPRQKSTPSPLTQHRLWDSSSTRDRCSLPTQKDGVWLLGPGSRQTGCPDVVCPLGPQNLEG